jgi:hypothetical protein
MIAVIGACTARSASGLQCKCSGDGLIGGDLQAAGFQVAIKRVRSVRVGHTNSCRTAAGIKTTVGIIVPADMARRCDGIARCGITASGYGSSLHCENVAALPSSITCCKSRAYPI